MMTMFILIRHGETDWNRQRRYQGQADTGLNSRGTKQANELAMRLKEKNIVALYSSDLLRALQTAEIIAQIIKKPIYRDARLREIRLGDWQGKSRQEVQNQYAELVKQRREDPLGSTVPGGERGDQVLARMQAAFRDIQKQHPGEVVAVISHGFALGIWKMAFFHRPANRLWELIPKNAQAEEISWSMNQL
jgi:broad specificity phosphatase PhoE